MKRVTLLLIMTILSTLLIGCSKEPQYYERISTVDKEVEYGYIAYNDRAITNDFVVSNFLDEATKLVKDKNKSYVYGEYYTDNYIYYLYQYDGHKPLYQSSSDKTNKYRFDVGLFRASIVSGNVELLYDFKNVYPIYEYDYSNPHIYTNLVDDNYLAFSYNGKLEIFDLEERKIIYTKELHEQKAYVNAPSYPYRTNTYGDHYAIIDNVLHYNKYNQTDYSYKTFDVDNRASVIRYGDIIFIYQYEASKKVYTNAFDLNSGDDVNLDWALYYMEAFEEEHKDESGLIAQEFIYKNVKYNYEISSQGDSITIKDSEDNVIFYTNTDNMKNDNEAYKKLSMLWVKNREVLPKPTKIMTIDDKLFIIFKADHQWGHYGQPTYIYECDLDNNKIRYVGYHAAHDIDHIIIKK